MRPPLEPNSLSINVEENQRLPSICLSKKERWLPERGGGCTMYVYVQIRVLENAPSVWHLGNVLAHLVLD